MVENNHNLPQATLNEVANSDKTISLYDTYQDLKEKVKLPRRFDEWHTSTQFKELVAGRKFRLAKKTIKAGNGTKDVEDRLIDEDTAKLIITHYSKEVKQELIKQDTAIKSISDDDILAKAWQILNNRLAEQQAKIAQLEPIAQRAIARQENKENLTSLTATYKNLQTEVPNQPFKKRKDFLDWLVKEGYCFRNKQGDLEPYARHLDKIAFVNDGDDDRVYSQAKFTEYGRNWLFIRVLN